MILEYETVSDIASLMMWGDVMEYSRRHSGGESNERKESETSSSPTTVSSMQGSASTQGTSLSPSIPIRNNRERDQDDDSRKNPPDEYKIDYTDDLIIYPEWLIQLNIAAQEKRIELVFSNSDIMQDASNFQAFVEWGMTTEITSAYHGCAIEEDSFVDIFQSFIFNGVQARATRRGYYSVTAATYWTNSMQYARIWPITKANL